MPQSAKTASAVILAVLAVWYFFIRDTSVELGPGIHAPDPPVQNTIRESSSMLQGEYVITPLADFQVQAKVLGRKNYSWDAKRISHRWILHWAGDKCLMNRS